MIAVSYRGVARKNPIPEREKQIGKRLRAVRRQHRLTQAAISKELHIDRALLASYESGRVPARYHFADRFCAYFRLSQRWLAENKEPERWYVFVDRKLQERIDKTASFTSVYDSVLRSLFENALAKVSDFTRGKWDDESLNEYGEAVGASIVGDLGPDEATQIIAQDVHKFLKALPPNLYQSFYEDFRRGLVHFRNENGGLLESFAAVTKKTEDQRKVLTAVNVSVTSTDVKAQWPILKRRLQGATAEKGGKTTLALFLGVQVQAVSQWLTDKKTSAREPGAETTLRMLQWVELQERK